MPHLTPACLRGVLLVFLPLCGWSAARADDPVPVVDLAERVRPAVAIVSYLDRDGQPAGIGTGFVVDSSGLIATNLHVIGEARPISVRFADGKSHEVISIHATDRISDLALLKIDAKKLPALPLGDASTLREGADLVAIGHPVGLEHSIVRGVLSGRREIDGRSLLQLAIPVERGNSGGPVLDRAGNVVGILTMKSAVTNNLGFAVPIDALKELLDKPNPVPIDRWLTIGRLDANRWTTKFGGNWRQRAGQIAVDGPGEGFGGRTLLLSRQEPPEIPFELAVTVRLDDESGAAGLVFGSDGDEKHYGFYPSAGGLRLSRFEGPDVFSWQVLEQTSSRAYRPGEWNTIKVRIETDRIVAFVNDVKTIDWTGRIPEGQVGLAAFRGTAAEFKRFRVGKALAPDTPSNEAIDRILDSLDGFDATRPPRADVVESLLPEVAVAPAVLEIEARKLERQAAHLRQLASAVQQRAVLDEFEKVTSADPPDLLHGALLIAKLDNYEIDVEAYLAAAEELATEVRTSLDKDADEHTRLAALDKLLFDQLGFHGSRTNYYHRSNSYLNEVIDDREGLPVALSVLYIDLASRLGVKVEGVGLPGHFVVRFVPTEGDPELIDVFDRGKRIGRDEAERLARKPLDDDAFAPVGTIAILDRMLRNLLNLARESEDLEATLRYTEAALVLDPDSPMDRLIHAFACVNTGRYDEALADCDRLLADAPEGLDLARVRQLREYVEEKSRRED